MDYFLVALDATPESIKIIKYLNRILKGARHIHLTLFHVLPVTSPNLLRREEVQRIEKMQEDMVHLSGYFWSAEDEDKMNQCFQKAQELLLQGEFQVSQINTHFGVQSSEVANVILQEAKALHCSTIVVGRRGLSRVKEFFLGSVSNSVMKMTRQMTVWVVED